MILISAGHYPGNPGACFQGTCEHEEATVWMEMLVAELSKHAPCLAVPTGTLPQKVSYINTHSPMFAIEIHFNSSAGKARGFETLHYPGSVQGKLLAIVANDAIAQCFEHNRGVKEGWYKMDAPGVEDYVGDVDGDESPHYFLQKTHCPAIIVEPEFIQRLDIIQKNREHVIEVLADALLAYYEDM